MPNIANMLTTCYKCKEAYSVSDKHIEQRTVNIDGEEIYLTVLVCPQCGEEMTVQIDTKETKSILENQMANNYEIGVRKSAFLKIGTKLMKSAKRTNALLVKRRKALNLKYNGRVYYFHGENKKIGCHEPTVFIVG